MRDKNVIARLTVSGIKEMPDSEYERLLQWLSDTRKNLKYQRQELNNHFTARLYKQESLYTILIRTNNGEN
ncbi:MAG: hypothetical protein HRF51_04420 [bacterium]|jgi:uncharacterized membrane-anchored protein YhcB (DUF1043 family)